LLEIHRNEHCKAMSSREWQQMHRKNVSQTGVTVVCAKHGATIVWIRQIVSYYY